MMRTVSDRTLTVGLPNNTGPASIPIPLNLPDVGKGEVIAWIGNFGGSNVYLFEGYRSLADCQNQLADDTVGTVDCIMALSYAGPTRAPLPDDCRSYVTVFFEAANDSGQTQTVTMRIRMTVHE